jgi:hypothetical protein
MSRAFIHSRSNYILKVLGLTFTMTAGAMSQDPLARLEVVQALDLQILVIVLCHNFLPVIQLLWDLIHLFLGMCLAPSICSIDVGFFDKGTTASNFVPNLKPISITDVA